MFEKIILKSAHPEEYPDLEIVCRVIPNEEIGTYVEEITQNGAESFYAYKSAPVLARSGEVGEVIKTQLVTFVDGREYILSEEENVVKQRTVKTAEGEATMNDIVVTNHNSTSNEEYIVKAEKFLKTYKYIGSKRLDHKDVFEPVYDSRLLTQVPENVIIMTSWGAPAVCLAGSYIVTYDSASNDYNTIEKGAFDSTYTYEGPAITRKKN